MISYCSVPISSQKGVLFFETPGISNHLCFKHSRTLFIPMVYSYMMF